MNIITRDPAQIIKDVGQRRVRRNTVVVHGRGQRLFACLLKDQDMEETGLAQRMAAVSVRAVGNSVTRRALHIPGLLEGHCRQRPSLQRSASTLLPQPTPLHCQLKLFLRVCVAFCRSCAARTHMATCLGVTVPRCSPAKAAPGAEQCLNVASMINFEIGVLALP